MDSKQLLPRSQLLRVAQCVSCLYIVAVTALLSLQTRRLFAQLLVELALSACGSGEHGQTEILDGSPHRRRRFFFCTEHLPLPAATALAFVVLSSLLPIAL